jgi:hypothetical protein
MTTKNLLVNLLKPEKKTKKEKEREDLEKVIVPKVPRKRVITTTEKWTQPIDPENHIQYIHQIINKSIIDEKECNLILQQLGQKIGGYKGQDIHKNLYSEAEFVDIEWTLNLMKKCENRCFYCKKTVQVLYENVREPLQWTLERIDNDFGHNKGNVEIACLNCNLRRRTMYHERYLFTKELSIVKKQDS